MDFLLSSQIAHDSQSGWLVIPVSETADANSHLVAAGTDVVNLVKSLAAAGDFTGKLGSLMPIRSTNGQQLSRMLFVGLGNAADLSRGRAERALTTAFRSISDKPAVQLTVIAPSTMALGQVPTAEFVEVAAISAQVGSLGQDLYRTERARHPFTSLTVVVTADQSDSLHPALHRGRIVGEAINLARDLVNRAPQDMTPAIFARRAEEMAAHTGLACHIFDDDRLKAERMESLLAVARGSSEPARMVVLEHYGAPAKLDGDGPAIHLALVGKGVTFDSGGLSLKPTDGMVTMKCDMAGAATVCAAMTAIAQLKLPINVIGLMGLVENMPSGTAFKLGDILTARNGVTIEVLNTDAEGRLVLADVLSYTVDRKAQKIVDLATLTGACVVALGEDVAGAFTNNQDLCQAVMAAGQTTGEETWQLPMTAHYDELIKGDVADIKNTGGRWGGAITAAKFLERFVSGTPWVHLDIAGPAFASSNKPYREAGATGFFVKSLVELAAAEAQRLK